MSEDVNELNDSSQTAKDKRKRRSFWQPESQVLVDWLDSQNDLGTSLQLIIVDAIHRYGNGDVIQSHLSQRINGEIEKLSSPNVRERQAPAQTPSPTIPESQDAVEDITSSQAVNVEPTVDVSAVEPFEPIEDEDVDDEEIVPSPAYKQEEQVDTSSLFENKPVQAEPDVSPSTQGVTQDEAEQPAFDPVAVMLANSGSKMSD